MPPAHTDLILDAARLRTAIARLSRLVRQQDDSGYGPTFVATLNTIERDGPLTLGELAAHEKVAPPTITRIAEKLVARGLVVRTVDPHDRRVARLAISAKGRRELETFRRRRNEWLQERMARLEPDELAALLPALDVIERLVSMEDEA